MTIFRPKMAAVLGRGGGAVVDPTLYLLDDQFTTPEAAPIASPRTCEPGPGTATKTVDTGNKISISGGKLLMSTATVSNSDPKETFTPPVGTVIQNGDMWRFLWRFSASGYVFMGGGNNPVVSANGTALNTKAAGGALSIPLVIAHGVDYKTFIAKADELFVIHKVGDYFYLNGIANRYSLSDALVCSGNSFINFALDRVSLARLGTTWTYRTLATDYKEAPQANDTINTDADGTVRVHWRPAAGQTIDIQFRRTDDDNCWIFRVDQANSRVYLFEKQGGVETERGATGGVAYTVTANKDHYISVNFVGQQIQIATGDNWGNDETQKISYASATYNQTATGAKVNLAALRFASYPRTIPAAKLAAPFFG